MFVFTPINETHNLVGTIINCLCSSSCLATIRVGAQICQGTVMFNRVWPQSCLGTIVSGTVMTCDHSDMSTLLHGQKREGTMMILNKMLVPVIFNSW